MNKASQDVKEYLESCGFKVIINKEKVYFERRSKITFDLSLKVLTIQGGLLFKKNKRINFEDMSNFEVVSSERLADATPFEDGYKEYFHTVKLFLTDGKKIRLFDFVDRNEKGYEYMSYLVAFMREIIQKS